LTHGVHTCGTYHATVTSVAIDGIIALSEYKYIHDLLQSRRTIEHTTNQLGDACLHTTKHNTQLYLARALGC